MRIVKHYVIELLIVIAAFFLQCTAMNHIMLGPVKPNLMIIVIAVYGFLCGKISGMFAGLFTGLLEDVIFGETLGIYMLIFVVIGYLSGKARDYMISDDLQVGLSVIAGADFLYGLVTYAGYFFLRGNFHFGYALFGVMIPECLYTLLVSLILFPVLRHMFKYLERSAKKQEKQLF